MILYACFLASIVQGQIFQADRPMPMIQTNFYILYKLIWQYIFNPGDGGAKIPILNRNPNVPSHSDWAVFMSTMDAFMKTILFPSTISLLVNAICSERLCQYESQLCLPQMSVFCCRTVCAYSEL